MSAQARKEARRDHKAQLLRLYDLVIETIRALEPNNHSPMVDPRTRRQLYQRLTDIDRHLAPTDEARQALVAQTQVLREIAGHLARVNGLVKTKLLLYGHTNSSQPPRVSEQSASSEVFGVADHVIRIMGNTGLARTDAIDRVLKAQGFRAANARDLLRAGAQLLPESRWVEPFRRNDHIVAYRAGRPGRAIGLWLLTALGRQRYRALTDTEPAESELVGAVQQPGHSLDHALGILELAEALERLGCAVDRTPAPIAVDAHANPAKLSQSPHIVPDLVIRAAPPEVIPAAGALRDLIVEYEMNGNAAGSHAEQWAKRARRLGVCAIVLPNAQQQENMRYELARTRLASAFAGLALTCYLSNLPTLLKGESTWETLVLRNP